MFPPLNGEHGEVVALLGIAHEVGHGLHHTLDERTGFLRGGLYHLHVLCLFYAEVQPVLANFQLQSYDGFCLVPTIFMLFVRVCYDMEAVL